ncbi:hypothetical protein Bca52824_086007 [Brassica carinata]|uniref:Uncharacterized protein n=1 Tax=Brassica carinata TaxID=52824 RepID=A0A8X7P5H4_BRACI|nr:hypothetical protein Bca52824_086007 [Brassica carinata]
MMLEDLRVQAKWAALPDVAKLLPLPNFCNIFLQSRPIAWHVNRATKRWSNQITIHVFLFREESQTKRLKRMFQTRFKIPYQFLDTHPFVDSLVQSGYHLSLEVDPFSVYWEDNFSGGLFDFTAESNERCYIARQGAFLQP